jgi:beta-D-xylosidase 4
MGAAFDDQLIEDVATVISTEARAFNNANRTGLDFWTPNINPFRDPRWGRGQETPGEDPFHLSSYVRALIKGLQGDASDPYKRVIATCKHFAGYDMESWNGECNYTSCIACTNFSEKATSDTNGMPRSHSKSLWSTT